MQEEIQAEAWDRFGNAVAHTQLHWVSRDESVALVSAAEPWKVESRGTGETWIVAHENGVDLDSARVIVRQIAGSIRLDSILARFILLPGDTTRYPILETRDINGQLMRIGAPVFTSDDSTIVAVSSSGLVVAVRPGTTTIRVTDGQASQALVLRVAPDDEANALSAEQVSLGNFRPCVVQPGGRGLCWGTMDGSVTDGPPGVPREIVGGGSWQLIESGLVSTCGIQTSGEAFCFRHARHPVATPLQLVTGGMNETCGLGTNSRMYCWSTWSEFNSRTVYPNEFAPEFRFTRLSGSRYPGRYTGEWVYCGLDADGRAFCWGWNNRGQLGRTTGDQMLPGPVDGNLRFRMISPGPQHTCGITESFEAYCWGSNFRLQLGMSQDTLVSIPFPQRVASDQQFASIQTGFDHTCAVTLAGVLYCWGSNFFGELGDGTTVQRAEPRPVAGNHRFRTDARSLSLGISQTCAITEAGKLLCWGDNWWGTLGFGELYANEYAAIRKPAPVLDVP